MPDTGMAPHAEGSRRRMHGVRPKLGHELGMATNAILLEGLATALLHDDRFGERSGRELLGVPVAVLGLCEVLRKEPVWEVALDAHGHRMMAGFLPRIELRTHDVAIDARLGIRLKVRKALRVAEREASDAERDAEA